MTKTYSHKRLTRNYGIEDVDSAFYNWWNTKLNLSLLTKNGTRKKVPIFFFSAERWAKARETELRQDKDGSLILPLIAITRPAPSVGNEGPYSRIFADVKDQHIYSKQVDAKSSKIKNLLDARPSNINPDLPIYEMFTAPAPDHYQFQYEIKIWAQYVEEINEILEKIGQELDFKSERSFQFSTVDGYYFIAFQNDDFLDESNLDDFSQNERIIKMSTTFNVPAPLLPQSNQKENIFRHYLSQTKIVIKNETALTEEDYLKLLNNQLPYIAPDKSGTPAEDSPAPEAPAPVDMLTFQPLSSFTRTGEAAFSDPRAGWAFAAAGAAAWKATDTSRLFSDDTILIEGARTNLVPNSMDLSAWSVPVGVVGSGSAPDGSETAWTLEDDSASFVIPKDVAIIAGSTTTKYVCSLWVKKDAAGVIPEIQLSNGTEYVLFQIDTDTGDTTVRSHSGLEGTPTTYSVDEGDWWFLVCNLETGASFGSSWDYRIFPAAATTLGGISGGATGSIVVWNPTVEAGSFPSSPIRTSGSAVTRGVEEAPAGAATSAFYEAHAVDTWPIPASGTDNGAVDQIVFAIDNGLSANRYYIAIHPQTTTTSRIHWRSDGGSVASADLTFNAFDKITIHTDWQNDVGRVYVNDVLQDTVDITSINDWSGVSENNIWVGSKIDGTEQFFGVIGQPTALP